MLNWADRFNICCFLDSHSYGHYNEEWILGVEAVQVLDPKQNILEELHRFYEKHDDWLFGHISYDVKNSIEPLTSSHPDKIQFPELFFFQPSVVIRQVGNDIEIASLQKDPAEVFEEIQFTSFNYHTASCSIDTRQRISREAYIEIINKLRQHISRGDCYEINFCMEFYAETVQVNPLYLYQQLTSISPTPFAGYYKLNDKYLCCASPERFLQKKGNEVISQPIKGTIKRDLDNQINDKNLKQQLASSQKDKSENVMVVDLVRNDLSKICKEGSVVVDELFTIYTFPQVHQMISTVKGALNNKTNLADILQATFPMGSMTGAPKRRVMELIEQYEKTKRGIYSGCIGYVTPEKDFDFNVVIRSIMYNSTNQYLSYQVGGGITFSSDPENEYEECMLKASAIKKVLG